MYLLEKKLFQRENAVRKVKEKEKLMDEQKRRKIDRMVFRISLIPLLLGVVYMFYSAFSKKELGVDYYIVLALGLGLHWLLSDVVSIIFSKGFEGKTEAQQKAYKIYAALNLAGFAGLGFFACSVGSNNGIWGALVYVMTLSQKRKYLDEYKGIVKEKEKEDSEEEIAEDAEEPADGEAAEDAEEAVLEMEENSEEE